MAQSTIQFLDRHTSEILSTIGTLAALGYSWHLNRFRSRLKDDLEIVDRYGKLIGEGAMERDPHYKALRHRIEQKMYEAYERPGVRWKSVIVGLVICILGGFNFLLESPPAIMSMLVGTLAIASGIASMLAGFVQRFDTQHKQ